MAANQAALDEALWLRYRDSDGRAIRILDQAVHADPHDMACWVALIDRCGSSDFSERASRTALQFNPRNPTLLIARSRLLSPAAALDVLAELATIPGYEKEAADRTELAIRGIRQPPVDELRQAFYPLTDQLLREGAYANAKAVVDRELADVAHLPEEQRKSRVELIMGFQAVLSAIAGDEEGSLRAQKSAGFRQRSFYMPGPDGEPLLIFGLGDLLLGRGKPALALESFGGIPPSREKFRDYGQKWVRAKAIWLTTHDIALAQAEIPAANRRRDDLLILVHLLLLADRKDEAGRLADEVASRVNFFGSHQTSETLELFHSASFGDGVAQAVRFVRARHPKERDAIDQDLGDPDAHGAVRAQKREFIKPASIQIVTLRHDLADTRLTSEIMRRELASLLAETQQYQEAANVLAPLAVDPTHIGGGDALQWCLLNRRADAEALYQKDPDALSAAFFLMQQSCDPDRWRVDKSARNRGLTRVEHEFRLKDDQIIEKVVKMGPGVLSAVFDHFHPRRVQVDSRVTEIAIIEQLGGVEDTPLLIDTMNLLVQEADAHRQTGHESNDLASLAALNRCLKKLTGGDPPVDATYKQQAVFWTEWRSTHAGSIAVLR